MKYKDLEWVIFQIESAIKWKSMDATDLLEVVQKEEKEDTEKEVSPKEDQNKKE